MNELQIFNNEEFGQIRTVTINDEPWFVGKDVAEALGYERTADAIRQHVEEEDKLTRCFADSVKTDKCTSLTNQAYTLLSSVANWIPPNVSNTG